MVTANQDLGADVAHVDAEESAVKKLAEPDVKFVQLSSEAKMATEAKHAMTVRQAIQLYPQAIVWSVFFSTAIAMEGYDLVLTSAFYAFPPFAKRYGVLAKDGKSYQISATWQAGLSNGARAGEILGLLFNGIICDRFGFKKTMIAMLCFLTGLIFIPFFVPNIETLVAG